MESGLLEIYRFLPPALLEDFDIEEIGLDEFLRYVAKARYIQELEGLYVAFKYTIIEKETEVQIESE